MYILIQFLQNADFLFFRNWLQYFHRTLDCFIDIKFQLLRFTLVLNIRKNQQILDQPL